MKTKPEDFESGTFPPYAEVAARGHDKFANRLKEKIAATVKRVMAKREREKEAKKG